MKKGDEISRRGFLKTAAALGAALTIQPAINTVSYTHLRAHET